MKWRYSNNKFINLISRLMCFFGNHIWLWHNGRPLNCCICGMIGHPLEFSRFNKKIEDLLVEKESDK